MVEGEQGRHEAAVALLEGTEGQGTAQPSPEPSEGALPPRLDEAEGEQGAQTPEGVSDDDELEGGEEAAEAKDAEAKDAEAKAKQSPGWKAFARKAAKLKEERRAFDEAKASFRAQTDALSHKLKAAEEYDQLRVLFRDDPTAALERLGATYADITDHVLKAGTPEAKIEQLERQLREQRERDERAAQQAGQQRAERAFVAIASRAEAYPDLAEFAETFGEAELLQNAYGVANDLRQRLGRTPADEEIAKELDSLAKTYHDKIRTRGGGRTNSPTPASDTGTGQRSKPSVPRAPKTMTNHHAREAKGIPKRETDEDRAERARQMLAGLKHW